MGGLRRSVVAAAVVAALVPVAATAGPRHETSYTDPTGTARVQVWLQQEQGALRAGHAEQLSPGSARVPLPLDHLVRALPVETDPEAYEPPAVEPPDQSGSTHLPDLRPLPAWDVYLDTEDGEDPVADGLVERLAGGSAATPRRAIRFGATIANLGKHSLEVLGLPQPGTGGDQPVRIAASQCLRFAGPRVAGSGRLCQEYAPVGSLVFHPQHGHFHLDGFAQYRLLRDRGGKPDTGPGGAVAVSGKVGYCLGDTTWMGERFPTIDSGWYRECRHTAPHVPATFRQGISPGWGDSYGSNLVGQHLLVDRVPDGVYWIAITVNAGGPGAITLQETNRTNNTSFRAVVLSGGGTKLKVL